MSAVWLCDICTLFGGDAGEDLVDDHSPPCDCCGLEPEAGSVVTGNCDRCPDTGVTVYRYLPREEWDAKS